MWDVVIRINECHIQAKFKKSEKIEDVIHYDTNGKSGIRMFLVTDSQPDK
jgi:hypothetical protein